MAALFLFAAAVQYNDPNPSGWMAFYVAAAIPCVLAMRGRLVWPLPAIVALAGVLFFGHLAATGRVSFAWGELFSHWRGSEAGMMTARETLGLALATLWMCCLAFVSIRWRFLSHDIVTGGSRGVAYR